MDIAHKLGSFSICYSCCIFGSTVVMSHDFPFGPALPQTWALRELSAALFFLYISKIVQYCFLVLFL